MNSKQRYDNFFNLESKYKLFDIKFKNKYPVWGAYRIYFNYFDLKNKKLFDAPVVIVSFSLKNLLNYSKLFLKCNICKIFYKRKKYIILEHPRSQRGIDIYTSNIVDIIGDKSLRLSFTQEFKNLRKNTIYLDTYKIFSKIVAKICFRFLDDSKFEKYKQFLEEFQSDISLYGGFKRYFIEFIVMYHFYKMILKFHRPKIVFLVVGYENVALLVACKELGIPSVEIQHGLVYKYHLGYGYPFDTQEYLEILPDEIATFSKYWARSLFLPTQVNIIPLGNNYMTIANNNSIKQKYSILFVSQGVIGGQLAKFLELNLERLQQYKVYFKLHPSEFTLLEDKYKVLVDKQNQYKNFKIICDEMNIDTLQEFCEYQVGVFSTAIYEGLQRGCKTIVLDIDGIEAIEDLIDNNYVEVCSIEENILSILNQNKISNKKHIFFSPFNQTLFSDILQKRE